jgi:hypothetical protein
MSADSNTPFVLFDLKPLLVDSELIESIGGRNQTGFFAVQDSIDRKKNHHSTNYDSESIIRPAPFILQMPIMIDWPSDESSSMFYVDLMHCVMRFYSQKMISWSDHHDSLSVSELILGIKKQDRLIVNNASNLIRYFIPYYRIDDLTVDPLTLRAFANIANLTEEKVSAHLGHLFEHFMLEWLNFAEPTFGDYTFDQDNRKPIKDITYARMSFLTTLVLFKTAILNSVSARTEVRNKIPNDIAPFFCQILIGVRISMSAWEKFDTIFTQLFKAMLVTPNFLMELNRLLVAITSKCFFMFDDYIFTKLTPKQQEELPQRSLEMNMCERICAHIPEVLDHKQLLHRVATWVFFRFQANEHPDMRESKHDHTWNRSNTKAGHYVMIVDKETFQPFYIRRTKKALTQEEKERIQAIRRREKERLPTVPTRHKRGRVSEEDRIRLLPAARDGL